MNLAARGRLLSEIRAQRSRDEEVAVSLELFFTGNDDPGSIGCNLGSAQPSMETFRDVLLRLRARPEVQDLVVRITDAEDDTAWPFTDTLYVISSLPPKVLGEALSCLRYDALQRGWMHGKPPAVATPREGFSPYSVWWD